MTSADMIREQARERHQLDVPEDRAREIAAALQTMAEVMRTHRHRLAFDDSPGDHARLLRLGPEPGGNG